jgi:hypothetical protein
MAGGPVGGSCKPLVAAAAHTALGQDVILLGIGQVDNDVARVCMGNNGASGKEEDTVFTVFAVSLLAHSRLSVPGLEQSEAAIIVERSFALIDSKDDTSPIAAVSTIRPASFDEPLPPEACAPAAAITGSDSDNCFIYKFHAS